MFCTAQDVMEITGKSVSHEQVRRAQYVIEMYSGATDVSGVSEKDAYWLKVATAYQTAYDDEQTGRPAAGISRLDQGDLSVSFEEGADLELAPKAARALKRLTGRGVRSVRVGTLYQYPVYEQGWEAI